MSCNRKHSAVVTAKTVFVAAVTAAATLSATSPTTLGMEAAWAAEPSIEKPALTAEDFEAAVIRGDARPSAPASDAQADKKSSTDESESTVRTANTGEPMSKVQTTRTVMPGRKLPSANACVPTSPSQRSKSDSEKACQPESDSATSTAANTYVTHEERRQSAGAPISEEPRVGVGGDSHAAAGGDSPAKAGGDSPAKAGGDPPATAGGDSPATAGGDSPAGVGGDSPAKAGGDSPATAGGDSPAGVGGDPPATTGGDSPAGVGGDSPAMGESPPQSTSASTDAGSTDAASASAAPADTVSSPAPDSVESPVASASGVLTPTAAPKKHNQREHNQRQLNQKESDQKETDQHKLKHGKACVQTSPEAKMPAGPVSTCTRDEGDIPIRAWRSAKELPWAVLLCIHGFGLSMNSYDRFGQKMSALGIPTYAIDVRGFGNWQNAEGHNELDFDDAIGDVQKALKAIRKAHPNLPIYLVGESMGGALALQAMAADQSLAEGLICSVPAQDRFGEKAEDARVALAMLRGFNHKINMGSTVVKQITANPTLRKELQTEAGSRMEFSPKELLRFQKFMNQTDKRARLLNSVPTLILQGGSDRLVKPRGTGLVFMNLAAKNKDFVLIGSSEHLLLEESQFNDHVIDVLTSWIYENSALRKLMERSVPVDGHAPADIVKSGGHLRIAQGLLDLQRPKEAENHLRLAVALGRGTPLATTASQLLAGLYQPKLDTPASTSENQASFVTHADAMANDKPSVIFFAARWIDSAYDLNRVLKRGIQKYGDKVNFVRIDCDDPKNADLVDGYGIAVVPTIVFLDPANHPVSYQLGSLTDETLSFEMPKIRTVIDNCPIAMPEKAAAMPKKPSVVIFGHSQSESFKLVASRLKGILAKLNDQVDYVTVDADDPSNAKLFHQYGNNPLPVVLFTNSSHDVISFSTGPVSAVELNKKVQKLIIKKMLPKKRQAKGNK